METDNKELQQQHQTDERRCSLLGLSSHVADDGGLYDKPLPCFHCGIGWFCFVAGFIFPLFWYYATILYLRSYYLKDPREREGLAASAIAALICSVMVLILMIAVYYL
ncbi:large ribosomal subunit protein eL20z-like [Aristolochia californica]|uniref:large ribosomal subunit protein eL20z-like n=1 Tax=Aristolochia californica TaxID=171875 RepID=UPI0035D7D6E0